MDRLSCNICFSQVSIHVRLTIVITLFILLLSPFAFAQNLNGVVLNDGTSIYGDVYESSQNSKWINIKKKDGSTETIRRDEVLKFLNIGSTPSLSYKKDYIRSNNIMIKLGAYIPDNDIEDADTGFYDQITYNRYINKNFAFEIGGGFLFTSATGAFQNNSGDEINVSGDLYVYNFISNLKAVFLMSFGEIYAGIGPGIYVIYADQYGTGFVIDDSDTVFGAQAIAGINFNLNKVLFLGFEGQYIFTGDAEFSDGTYSKSFNINGFNISAVIGFRF